MIVIKKANPSHKSFIKLGEKSFKKTHGDCYWKGSLINSLWRHPSLNIYVAEYKGIPVAYVLMVWNNAWFLDTIYTKPGFRKKGIMKKLLKESFSLIRKKYVLKEVFADNMIGDIASDKVLFSLGFEMISEDANLYNGKGGKNFKYTSLL